MGQHVGDKWPSSAPGSQEQSRSSAGSAFSLGILHSAAPSWGSLTTFHRSISCFALGWGEQGAERDVPKDSVTSGGLCWDAGQVVPSVPEL